MNIALGLLLVLVVAAITVTAMLLVRRRAPEGSYFTDGDRASGVFGVLATGFSVLLGLLRAALDDIGFSQTPFTVGIVDTDEAARARRFAGLPAFIVDGTGRAARQT